MKKITTLTLCALLAATCLFSGMAVSATTYPYSITLNNAALDVSALPPSQLLPLRLIAENDHGYANWYEETNEASFTIADSYLQIDLNTMEATLDNQPVEENIAIELINGVTFADAALLNQIPGVSASFDESASAYTIHTPNGKPINQLAYQIMEETGMGMVMKASDEETDMYGITRSNFDELVCFNPMIINADTVYIGTGVKDMALAEQEFQARKDAVIKSFENYLPGPYEMAKKGRIVKSGDCILLIISSANDVAIDLFEAAAPQFSQSA